MNPIFGEQDCQHYIEMLKSRDLYDPDNPPIFTSEEYKEYLSWCQEELMATKQTKEIGDKKNSIEKKNTSFITYKVPENTSEIEERHPKVLKMPKRRVDYQHRNSALVGAFFFASCTLIFFIALFIIFWVPPLQSPGDRRPTIMRMVDELSQKPQDKPKKKPKVKEDPKPKPKPQPKKEPKPETALKKEPKPKSDPKPKKEPKPKSKPEPKPEEKTPNPLPKPTDNKGTPNKSKTKTNSYKSIIAESKPHTLGHRLSSPNRDLMRKLAGGSEEATKAVLLALKWLAAHQQKDGSWVASKTHERCRALNHKRCGHDAKFIYPVRFNTAVTSLSLLCFLGAGNTHLHGEYKDTVKKAVNWLIKNQEENGNFGPLSIGTAPTYCTPITAVALLELASLTNDNLAKRCKVSAQKALNFIIDSQNECGGWDYNLGAKYNDGRKNRGDTPISSWNLMALYSANNHNIHKGEGARAKAVLFLRNMALPNGQSYYDTHRNNSNNLGTSAAMMVAEYYAFLNSRQKFRDAQSRYILKHPPVWDDPSYKNKTNSPYYWYLATMAMYHRGGPDWKKWYSQIEPLLLEKQETQGGRAGSWPGLVNGNGANITHTGGRVTITAFCTLTLETTWRFLPMYAYNPKLKSSDFKNLPPEELILIRGVHPRTLANTLRKLHNKELPDTTIKHIESFLLEKDKLLRISSASFLVRRKNVAAIPVICKYIEQYPDDGSGKQALKHMIKHFPKEPKIPRTLWTLIQGLELVKESKYYFPKLAKYKDKNIAKEIRAWVKRQNDQSVIDSALNAANSLEK